MKPSLGRIVHYRDVSCDDPRAAIITEVDDRGDVTVAVFSNAGTFVMGEKPIFWEFRPGEAGPPMPPNRWGYWSWPPRVE